MELDSIISFNDHVRGCDWKNVLLSDTSLLFRFYYVFVVTIPEYCSPVWRSASDYYLLEPGAFSSKALSWPRFGVAGLCAVQYIFRTIIIICSVSCSLLPEEFDKPEQLSRSIQRRNLLDVSCRPKFVCGMTFHTLCSTLDRWTGLREQSISEYFLSSVCRNFSWCRCLWGCKCN